MVESYPAEWSKSFFPRRRVPSPSFKMKFSHCTSLSPLQLFNIPFPYAKSNTKSRASAQPAPSAANPSCELDILLHDGDALGVDGTQVCVFEQVHYEGFTTLLERLDGLRLPSQWLTARGYERESNFANLCWDE